LRRYGPRIKPPNWPTLMPDNPADITYLNVIYRESCLSLQEAGIQNPRLDARILIREIASLNDIDFLDAKNVKLGEEQLDKIDMAIQERCTGRPVSKILGFKEFYGRNFKVTEDTLDPRPDTEILVDAVLSKTKKDEVFTICDLGTGTGCIILTILAERPNATGVGVDISETALDVAKYNAEKINVLDRVKFIKSNWLDQVADKFDIIVSNPPYIESNVIPELAPEVRNHDPILALDGGETGLNSYDKIISQSKHNFFSHGNLFLELGISQLPRIKRLVEKRDATLNEVYLDLSGIARVVEISYGDK